MLTITKKEPTRSPITFVKDELMLALTKKGNWKLIDDLEETEELLQVENFSFGKCYGVIHHKEVGKSQIKIKSNTWYIVTDIKTSMPLLKSKESQDQRYLELKPVEYKYSIF